MTREECEELTARFATKLYTQLATLDPQPHAVTVPYHQLMMLASGYLAMYTESDITWDGQDVIH